jgi:hypothetical protein
MTTSMGIKTPHKRTTIFVDRLKWFLYDRYTYCSMKSVRIGCRGGSSLIRKVQVFHRVVHEGTLLSTLPCGLQRYYPNITIIWDGRICMFAVLLRFTIYFVYKVYRLFVTFGWPDSCCGNSTINFLVKEQYIWKHGCMTTSTCLHINQDI